MPFLLDTNVLSELRKHSKCDRNVVEWAKSRLDDRHYISVLSLGEMRKGIEILRRKAEDQCPAFESWLNDLRVEYEECILPITEEVADRWGKLTAEKALPAIDSLIAATALEFGLTVVTRNAKDFEPAGVDAVNPFDPMVEP